MNASRDGGGGIQGREGARDTDRKAGSLLITMVFNIRKCQNGNGAHITLSIALLAAAAEEKQETGWKNHLSKAAGLNFHLPQLAVACWGFRRGCAIKIFLTKLQNNPHCPHTHRNPANTTHTVDPDRLLLHTIHPSHNCSQSLDSILCSSFCCDTTW